MADRCTEATGYIAVDLLALGITGLCSLLGTLSALTAVVVAGVGLELAGTLTLFEHTTGLVRLMLAAGAAGAVAGFVGGRLLVDVLAGVWPGERSFSDRV